MYYTNLARHNSSTSNIHQLKLRNDEKMTKFIFIFALFSFVLPTQAFANDDGYVILPGDVLQVSVWKEVDMDREIVILPDGSFSFPLIGTLNAKNKTPTELQNIILDQLRYFIPEAAVTVVVKAPLGHKVSVMGEVQTPGDVFLSSNTTVTQALSQVGGFTPYADEDDIIIVRKYEDGTKEKIEFSFDDLSKGRDLENDIDLVPGDIIIVPASGLF
jgi:polysaccharide export outer membrane protein